MTAHDPYVADPAEPARTPRLGQRIPLVATLALTVAILAVGVLLFTRGSTQDPAVGNRPSPAATDTQP